MVSKVLFKLLLLSPATIASAYRLPTGLSRRAAVGAALGVVAVPANANAAALKACPSGANSALLFHF